MAGIGGIINITITAQIIEEMQTALKCRGADVHGTYNSEKMCLIHTGHKYEESRQPLRAVFGRKAYVLVFDGEIYNRKELRLELSKLGHKFQEDTDAAVVLHAYMAWGQACVEQFNGVFAFAVWDETGLFLARDRLGIRPLYYHTGQNGLVFASSISGILAHTKAKIDPTSIAELILIGPGRLPGSAIFSGIKELAPGECAYYKNELAVNTYWRLKAKTHQDNFAQTVETVRGLVGDAIKRQSDGKQVAALLSGGLDSSAIVAISGISNTFSVDYTGSSNADNEFINLMVNYRRLNHTSVLVGSDEIADALEDAMDARGLPGMADVDSALLLLLRRVGEGFGTTLSGEGADEIFGGYPWYQDDGLLNSDTFPWAQNVEYRARFLPHGLLGSPKDYVQNHFNRGISAANTLYDDDKTEKRIRQMTNLNLGWFLQTLLTRADSMGAMAKVSVRMPFLDYRLVEYMYNVPWQYKNHGDQEKGLLREALKGLLPEKILTRKKSPFPKTHNPGYTRRVQDMLREVLNDEKAPVFKLVSKKMLTELLEDNLATSNWYGQLMSYPQTVAYFLQINAWAKKVSW